MNQKAVVLTNNIRIPQPFCIKKYNNGVMVRATPLLLKMY